MSNTPIKPNRPSQGCARRERKKDLAIQKQLGDEHRYAYDVDDHATDDQLDSRTIVRTNEQNPPPPGEDPASKSDGLCLPVDVGSEKRVDLFQQGLSHG